MDHATLSTRQAEMLWHVDHRHTTSETAAAVGIAEATAATHVERAYEKIGASNRGEAMLWLREHRRCCLLRPLYSSETLGEWVRSLMGPNAPPPMPPAGD